MTNLTRRVLRSGLTRSQRWWQRTLELGTMPRFRNEPSGFEMRWPRSLVHSERMTIGRDVKLGPNSELKCNTHYPGTWMRHPARVVKRWNAESGVWERPVAEERVVR